MKTARIAAFASIIAAAFGICTCAWAQAQKQTDTVHEFLGRWDITLKSLDHEYPSWIEINKKDGELTALFTGRWGNARPLPRIDNEGNQITFVSPKEEESSNADLTFKGTLQDGQISGTLNGPDGKVWSWRGVRAPSLKHSGTLAWRKETDLFNGRDLSGWHQSKTGPPDWSVKDGSLMTPGNGPELISDSKFKDFKLHIEFKCDKESNSGVYLRGRYEVQIETDSVAEPASHHTGGVYGFIAPSPELPRSADVWQKFDITLVGRKVTVVQNGRTVIDDQEIPGLTGGALDSDEAASGPIYLQGSEKGHVFFRKISIAQAK